MSSWVILTVRARAAEDYDLVHWDSSDPWQATADLAATMDADDRVRQWTTTGGHAYAYLACDGGDVAFAETVLEDYAAMVYDAVILTANNTSDLGTARYYCEPSREACIDEVRETTGTNTGEKALATMYSRHGIIALDPFHNNPGEHDVTYLDDGTVRAGEFFSE